MSNPARSARRRQFRDVTSDDDLVPIAGTGMRMKAKDVEAVQDMMGKVATAQRANTAAVLAEYRQPWEIGAQATQSIDGIAQQSAGKHLWDCRSGCHSCCHGLVEITPPEAFLIAEGIQRDAMEDIPEIRAFCEKMAPIVERESKAARASGRIDFPTRCGFLDERGRCGIYGVRPIVCRGYYSFSRKSCDDQLQGKDGVDQDMMPLMSAIALSVGMCKAITQAALDGELYELHAAVLCALTDADAAERWKRGEPFMPKVQHGN